MASSSGPHTGTMLPSITAPTMNSQSKWAKPEDWDKYKNTIQALFMMHSLSNVMRIMRDDHNFHATAKMYNVHIYQKWGMRKGRVEPTKEKKKKKRREGTADVESVASSTRHPGYASTIGDDMETTPQAAPEPQVQAFCIPRASTGYNQAVDQRVADALAGPPAHLPWELHPLDDDPADTASEHHGPGATFQTTMPCHDGGAPSSTCMPGQQQHVAFQQSTHPDNMVARRDQMTQHHHHASPAASNSLDANQFTWDDFLALSRSVGHPATQGQDAMTIPTTAPQILEHDTSVSDGTGSSLGRSSWMSAVLAQSPPSSVTTFQSRAPAAPPSHASLRSGVSKKSSRSRASDASSRDSRFSDQAASSTTSVSRSTKSKGSTKSSSSTVSLSSSSLRHLAPPDGLLLPESSMFYARHYISSVFSTGLWTLSQNTDMSLMDKECVKLDRWFNEFNPGQEMLNDGKVNEAFRIFKTCFAATKDIIEPQDPRVVIYICQQSMRFMYYDRLGRTLAQSLLKYSAGLCKELFSIHHPLYIIMSQLAKMDNFEFAANIRPLMDCYFDHLEPFLDGKSKAFGFVNELRGLTVSLMEAVGMLGIYEAKPILDRLTQRAVKNGQSSIFLRIELASILSRGRFFDQAISIIKEVYTPEIGTYHPYEYVYAGIVLMVTYRQKKDPANSIRVGYDMADYLSNPPFRPTDLFQAELSTSQRNSSLTLILSKLEKDLRDCGREAEAVKIKDRINGIYDEVYGTEDESTDAQAVVNALG